MTRRLAVYCPDLPPVPGGVADHTGQLARSLAKGGTEVVVLGRRGDPHLCTPVPCHIGVHHDRGTSGLVEACRDLHVGTLLLQYVPFLYGRLGLAPSLVRSAARLARGSVRFALMLHEPWVPTTRWIWRLTGPLMRRQTLSLVAASDAVFSPVPAFLDMVRHAARQDASLAVVPVGATVPVAPRRRAEARAALALADDEVAIGVFSPGASGALMDWVRAAVDHLARDRSVVWLVFGKGSERQATTPPEGPRVRHLGWLPQDEVAVVLSALDLAVAPFEDGLTLRRTSAMAALAYGVPLVSSSGPLHDASLAEAAPCPSSVQAFTETVATLAHDANARIGWATAGRAWYERRGSTAAGAQIVAAWSRGPA